VALKRDPFSKDIVSLNQLEIKERTKEKIVIFYSFAGSRNTSSMGLDRLFPSIDTNSTFMM
jgi:hypothetical protein